MSHRSDFSLATKKRIEWATGGICAICMQLCAAIGNACHIVDAANTTGRKMESESKAFNLEILHRKDERNGVWLCPSCHARISYGRAIFCPPSPILLMLIEAIERNPAMSFRQILEGPEATQWVGYYLLAVPNVNGETVEEFCVRAAKKYEFVHGVGFTPCKKKDRSFVERYWIHKVSHGPLTGDSEMEFIHLAKDKKRFSRLWFIPQIDIVNVMMIALWTFRGSSMDESSHCDVMTVLGRLYAVLLQRKLRSSALQMNAVTNKDSDDDENL
ncbi:hypothetical protein B0H16DRAFT_1744115 [Mycena metata]|uniref:HNH endonuclease n=1 Tax=Mycena metata TaxID=1033252 RepID=A0AAD7H501_9AGAR|nr:hypothetical protein B0H16DRAFT_1744115 [Mycena metata]